MEDAMGSDNEQRILYVDIKFEFWTDSATNEVIESLAEVKMVGEIGIPPAESAAGKSQLCLPLQQWKST